INYTNNPHFAKDVLHITNNLGVNVVYDSVGNITFDASIQSLAPYGLMVSFGRSSGFVPKFDLNKLATKSLFLTVPRLYHYKQDRIELCLTAMEVFGLIDHKVFPNQPQKIYNFDQISELHRDIEQR